MEETQKRLSQYVPLQIEGVDANADELAFIERAINSLGDPVSRKLLRLHYLQADEERRDRPRRWRKVAVMVYGDDDASTMRQVFRVHTKALREIKEKSHP